MNELTDYEKLVEGVAQLASLVSAYYKSLIDNGFIEKDALVLTIDYQNEIISLAKPNK